MAGKLWDQAGMGRNRGDVPEGSNAQPVAVQQSDPADSNARKAPSQDRRGNGARTADPLKSRPGRRSKAPGPSPDASPEAAAFARRVTRLANARARELPGYGKRINHPDAHPPEKVAQVEVDWRAGVMTIPAIAEKHGVAMRRIYRWAEREGWPRRVALTQVAAAAIEHETLRQAAAQLAGEDPYNLPPEAGGPPPETLDDAKSDAALESYITLVTNTLQAHRDMTGEVAGIGRELVTIFKDALQEMREDHKASPRELLKLASAQFGPYATLVRALSTAIDQQRRAWGMHEEDGRGAAAIRERLAPASSSGEEEDAPPNERGRRGAIPPIGAALDYDAVLIEAEARGVRLVP